MKQVVFLYNEWLDEDKQKLARLPLEFVCFAYIEGATMYRIKDNCVAIHKEKSKKYQRVYGALYILHNSEHSLRTLDAIMTCSKSFIGSNHRNDFMHRERIKAIPIQFKSIEDFLKMFYNEGEEINVITYMANPLNDVIKTYVKSSKNKEISGLDVNNFINLVIRRKKDEK